MHLHASLLLYNTSYLRIAPNSYLGLGRDCWGDIVSSYWMEEFGFN